MKTFLRILAFSLLGSLVAAAAEPPVTNQKETEQTLLPRTRKCIAGKQPVTVVIYGDSISEVKKGWSGGAKTPEANWGAQLASLLAKEYPGSTFSVKHFAIGGQNTYEGLGRIDGLEAFKPDLVLVAFGANDCCYHYLLPEETQLALSTMATEIRKRFDADVVVVGTGGDNPLKPFFKHLDETVAAQRQAAADASVPFVDMRKAVLTATENGKRWGEFHWGEANCHPNDKGHAVWAETAVAVLRAALRVR